MHDQRRASAPNTVGQVAPCLQLCITWAAENACCRRVAAGGDGGGNLENDQQNKLISCYLLSLENWFSFVTAATHRAALGPDVFTFCTFYRSVKLLPYVTVARPGHHTLGDSTEGTYRCRVSRYYQVPVLLFLEWKHLRLFCGWISCLVLPALRVKLSTCPSSHHRARRHRRLGRAAGRGV